MADHQPNVNNGFPIILPSKPLKFIIDQNNVHVAQNGFVAQTLDLGSGKVKSTFRGHAGPVTSLALFKLSTSPKRNRKILFTGSWDKTIKVWDTETQILLSTSVGHVDFIKSLHIIPSLNILVSGSTDRDIRVWSFKDLIASVDWNQVDLKFQEAKKAPRELKTTNLASEIDLHDSSEDAPNHLSTVAGLPSTDRTKWPAALYGPMACVTILKSHTRPIDAIASFPTVSPTEEETFRDLKEGKSPHLLVSGDSMGTLKIWIIRPNSSQTLEAVLDSTSWPHKTSINDIQIGCPIQHDIDHPTKAQLWTASADNSVLHSRLDLLPESDQRLVSIFRIEQPYFVRCLLNLPLCFSLFGSESVHPNWLITGSTDEDIRIYDLEQLEENCQINKKPSGNLASGPLGPGHHGDKFITPMISGAWLGCLKAHWHEVNCLAIWIDSDTRKPWLISSGLDGTLRRWSLEELERRFLIRPASKTAPNVNPDSQHHSSSSHGPQKHQFELTAAEEAELAQLMDQLQ